jgi:hypothetical protein
LVKAKYTKLKTYIPRITQKRENYRKKTTPEISPIFLNRIPSSVHRTTVWFTKKTIMTKTIIGSSQNAKFIFATIARGVRHAQIVPKQNRIGASNIAPDWIIIVNKSLKS